MRIDLPDPSDVARLVRELEGASADFARLLERYREPARALRHFGLLHWQAKQEAVAGEAFRAALALRPDDAAPWADLAGVYDAQSDPPRAALCLERALALDPWQARWWLLLANIRDRAGEAEAAELAYGRALALDPTLGDAHLGLGLLHFNRKRLDAAAASLRAAIANGRDDALGHLCLGHVLSMTREFAACAGAFEAAARFGPLDANARRKAARARTFLAMSEGRLEEALAAFPALAGADAEDIDEVTRDAFSLLSAYGFAEAALAVGRHRLAQNPDDPVQRYLLDAVSGRPLTRAPLDYVERYFDRFASEFDHKLVDVLLYRAPERLRDLLASHRTRFDDVLDLGCGTGLAADALAAFGGRLTGVDVSGRMLEEAKKRGRYAERVKADAIAYLDARPGRHDLVFAADLLVYLGDLAPLFGAVSRALVPGGLFAFSVEAAASGTFTLLSSGRFAHSVAYLERLARPDFIELEDVETILRLEAGLPVEGRLIVLRRR